MQLEQVCAAVWKGHVMGLRNIQGTTKAFFWRGRKLLRDKGDNRKGREPRSYGREKERIRVGWNAELSSHRNWYHLKKS